MSDVIEPMPGTTAVLNAAGQPRRTDFVHSGPYGPRERTPICSISDLTEHDHFGLETHSFCGIPVSASSVVKARWSGTQL
jgi:hypothetical protein